MPICESINCRSRGFTLIEVLVALMIVSLGMLGVIQAVGQAASNSSYLRDKTIAHWVAMNRLTELRLQKQPPARGESSGQVEMAGQRWRWQANVEQTGVASMSRIDISVAFQEADTDTQLASITGFFGTMVAPPGAARISIYNSRSNPVTPGQEGGTTTTTTTPPVTQPITPPPTPPQ
ncbi:MAG: type II secretion system minor pseudopilin GspI [Candidatus Obscuribacterales bacterium]|nr:type II secretion system minor pseudopilin GspI [Steroidobacteraceae bacterium]